MKIKTITIAMFFFSLTYSVFAQQKEKEHKWQISLQTNTVDKLPSVAGLFIPDEKYVWGSDKNKSYSVGLTANYFLKENIALRLKIDFLNRNIIQTQGDHSLDTMTTGGNLTSRAEITQKDFYLNPGIQWSAPYKKTNVFYGLQVPFNKYGEVQINYREEVYSNGIIYNAFGRTVNIPSGYSFGIGSFWGINVNLNKRISLGAEFSCDFLIYSVFAKGETTNTDTTYYYSPAFPTDITSGHSDNTTEKFSVLSLHGTLKINFSF